MVQDSLNIWFPPNIRAQIANIRTDSKDSGKRKEAAQKQLPTDQLLRISEKSVESALLPDYGVKIAL